jgi:hypothetical protein
MDRKAKERALECALLNLYRTWSTLPIPAGFSRPYYAERFRQMIVPGCVRYVGGVAAIRHVLTKRTLGLERLKAYPDLTVEALVATGKWDDLISEPYRTVARKRMARMSQ